MKRILKWSLLGVLFKALLLVGALSYLKAKGDQYSLCTWDCAYYRDIATQGYSYAHKTQGTLAFFPGFPVLVTATSFLPGLNELSFGMKGILLNLFLFGVFSFLLLTWFKDLGLSLKAQALAFLFVLFDRFTFWSHVPYTESLFVVLLMSFFYVARHLKNPAKVFTLIALGALASSTRVVGVAFISAFAWIEVWTMRSIGHFLKMCLVFVLGIAGLWGFYLYVHLHFGSWTYAPETTGAWNRSVSFIGLFENIFEILRRFYFPTAIFLILSLKNIFKPDPRLKITPIERTVFFFLLLIPLAQSAENSLTRYLSIIFIAPVALALILEKIKSSKLQWSLLLLYLLSEGFWQFQHTLKYFRSEAFNWAC